MAVLFFDPSFLRSVVFCALCINTSFLANNNVLAAFKRLPVIWISP